MEHEKWTGDLPKGSQCISNFENFPPTPWMKAPYGIRHADGYIDFTRLATILKMW